MATCELGFDHPEPEPVVVEEAPDTEPIADAAVEIARIEADKEVTIAKIGSRVIDDELAVELAALRAENEQLRAAALPAADEQQQEAVVVVADPEPEPEPESAPPVVGETSTPEPKSGKRRSAWW